MKRLDPAEKMKSFGISTLAFKSQSDLPHDSSDRSRRSSRSTCSSPFAPPGPCSPCSPELLGVLATCVGALWWRVGGWKEEGEA